MRQTPDSRVAALCQALEMMQQCQLQQQASSEGEAMEQDELPPPVSPPPPEQEGREAQAEGEIVRPLQGQSAHGRNKDALPHSSMDRPVKAVAKGPKEAEQQVSAALRATGGHTPPGQEVIPMPYRNPAVFHPETNYNSEAFPPQQWRIPQGQAQHMTAVLEQMPPA